jgi:hypothetical protein
MSFLKSRILVLLLVACRAGLYGIVILSVPGTMVMI